MKKLKIVMGWFLCGLMIFTFSASGQATSLSSITSDSIKEKQDQINQAEKEKEEIKNILSDITKMKKDLESQKKDLKRYVTQLDQNLEEIQNKISELEVMIAQKQADIETTQAQLEEAERVELEQYNSLKTQIQIMYEGGEYYYLDMIFSGDGFADMLNRIEYANQLYQYNQGKLEEYAMTKDLISYCKMQLDAEKEVLDEAMTGVETERENLEDLIAEKEKQILTYESDIKNKEKAIAEYEEDLEAQDQLIKDLEEAVAAEKKAILAASGVVLTYDGGQFKFPVAKYTRVSDDYGMRMHPTLGIQKFHSGVDLASPSGTAIYAAYDGQVVAAAYSSTMGNYVMIDHGDELYTIYMHASKLYVSKGDIVVRGETIAAVGSTGRSTGPHLHFGVRLNGSYVSPWGYISKP